jgi:DNA primase large subunit
MQSIKRERRTPRSGRDTLARKQALSGARRSGGPRDFQKYTHHLSLYRVAPNDEVSLEEFELFAVDRLRALKCIETAKIRFPKRGEEYTKLLRAATKENIPLSTDGMIEELYDQRRKDHISHFILRLAYCKSEELRRWFLTHECELFRYRFELEKNETILKFLKENNMEYHPIDRETKMELAPKLVACGFRLNHDDVMATDYFKVDFEQAVELVKQRKVYLQKGSAYIPKSEILTIIVGAFRAKLSAALTATSKALPNLEEDSRLLPMLANLSKQYLGNDYAAGGKSQNVVSAAAIPGLAEESFPMCMRHSHDALTANHHLKHGARMQYGLFLKGIGLTLEEALMFWRSEFCKSMPGDKFEKNYSYNIRHNYGKEGKRQDYTPYSCMKIIMSSAPATGDAHGCPFRHFDPGNLELQMMQYKVPKKGIKEVLNMVQNQHYQLACIKYFEATHDTENVDLALSHPNQYFEKSRELLGAPEGAEGAAKTPFGAAKPASPTTPAAKVAAAALDDDDDMELDDDAFLAAVEASA